jgi:hypothetical protein
MRRTGSPRLRELLKEGTEPLAWLRFILPLYRAARLLRFIFCRSPTARESPLIRHSCLAAHSSPATAGWERSIRGAAGCTHTVVDRLLFFSDYLVSQTDRKMLAFRSVSYPECRKIKA